MPKRFWRGWLVVCMLGCINAYPARQERGAESYRANSNLSGFTDNDYDFEDFSGDKYLDGRDEASVEESERDEISSTTAKNVYVRLPLVPEPDAEMLPAHYTGVQPPGVDHMEITSFDSAGMGSNQKSIVANGTKTADSKMATGAASLEKFSGGAKSEVGEQTKDDFEKGLRVESIKENRKGAYAEAAGKKKSHQETDKHFGGHKDETSGKKSVEFKVEGQRDKGHNAAGYRNVYHKDEYKKDADFYDNDHAGGRFRKHGHYDEKHVATESDFRKGGNRASEFSNAEAAKGGNFETLRAGEESKGHRSKSGYGGFFDKFDEFAKHTGPGQLFGENGQTAAKVS